MTNDTHAPRTPPPLPEEPSIDSIAPTALEASNSIAPPSPKRWRVAAIAFGTVVGAVAALSLRPLTEPASASPVRPDAARDAGVPDSGDAQAPMLTAIVSDVSWHRPREYPPFDRRAAIVAVEASASGMDQRCDLSDSELYAPASVTFAPSGIVVQSKVGGALTNSPRRACVEQWLERAEMPPFAGDARELRATVDMH